MKHIVVASDKFLGFEHKFSVLFKTIYEMIMSSDYSDECRQAFSENIKNLRSPKKFDSTYPCFDVISFIDYLNKFGIESSIKDEIVFISDSPILIGWLNQAKYSICGCDSSDDVKSYCDYVSQYEFLGQSFLLEVIFHLFWRFGTQGSNEIEKMILEVMSKCLKLSPKATMQEMLDSLKVGQVK